MRRPSSNAPLVDPTWLAFLEPVSLLYATNPFDPAWERLIRAALGDDYVSEAGARSPASAFFRNLERLAQPLATMLAAMSERLRDGGSGTPREIEVYRGAAILGLWVLYGGRLQALIDEKGVLIPFFDEFVQGHRVAFGHPGISIPEPMHLLALFYQARRAWYFPATKIVGGSLCARAARAAIWRANMGRDVCAYAGGLYRQMDQLPVLITGETGTGKDLAAQCIGWSRYIPLDAGARRFERRYDEDFHVRNLCEAPDGIVESILFGHRRGAFTGALADTPGLLAQMKEGGTLVLDEVGEIPQHLQAKLLRPLQNREFVPLGDNRPQKMEGRLVFVTHRDLEQMCREGKFRADLLERMSVLRVHMPPLRQSSAEGLGEMETYVQFFVARRIEDAAQAEALTAEVLRSIKKLRHDYHWPRNHRELMHFTERVIVAGEDDPAPPASLPPEAAATATDGPESTGVPSSGILGRGPRRGRSPSTRCSGRS